MLKQIVITIDNTNVGSETQTGVDEALFNFGIGDPDPVTGEQCLNMAGMWYEVMNIEVRGV